MIDKATVDKIYSAANIVEVVSDFVTLKKKGVNYQACCPFHNEKTPSFVVSPSKGVYKCFGCGKGGNAVSFVMEHENLSYGEALKYVARKYGIAIEEKELTEDDKIREGVRESMMSVTSWASEYFRKSLKKTDEGVNIGLSYFRERGFNDTIIERFGLGYCLGSGDALTQSALKEGYKEQYLIDTGLTIKRETGGYYDRFSGRVIFPVHSVSGRVIAFGGRTMRTDKKVAKYLNSPESEIYHKSNTLYGIFFAKKAIGQMDRCILVEGYTDVLSMFQAGTENVVASSGTSLTTEQIRLVKRFTNNITVIYDGDSAGIKASLRGIDMILAEGLNVRVVLLPDGEDPDTFARANSATFLNQYILDNEVDFITFKTRLLLSEAKNDPITRASVITDIVGSISVISDNIARSQYIKECGRLLECDESMLESEVAKRLAVSVHGSAAREIIQNSERKRRYIEGKEREQAATVLFNSRSPLDDLENELTSYLLRYGNRSFFFQSVDEKGIQAEPVELNVAETIIDELAVDGIEFRNSLFKRIYDDYVVRFRSQASITEEMGDIREVRKSRDMNMLDSFINHPDPEVCSFAVDLMSREMMYQPSKIWSKFDDIVITEEDNLNIAIPKAIALYKLKVIQELTREIMAQLTAAGDDAMELMRKMSTLNDSRRIISEKYTRIL